jgi:methionyl-tRNA formyltransferase
MRIVMMGTGTFAEPTFKSLLTSSHQVVGLVTQPDRSAGQERGSTRQVGEGMTAIARAGQVPVFQPESINTPEGIGWIQSTQPDLLAVAAYGQILSRDVLAAVPGGGINVHASLLPRYRGAAPVAWAIYHGETTTGVTIIKMSVHLDAGDILAQETIDIGPDETAGELEARLAVLGARLALSVVDQVAAGNTQGIKQDKTLATKAPKLTKEHGLIDWTRHGREVCNQIRAMQPWPTAYTFLSRPAPFASPPTPHAPRPLRLIVVKATWQANDSVPPSSLSPHPSLPGAAIVRPDQPDRLFVAAGGSSLVEILELQPAGKRRMSAAEFLRGRHLQPGDRFGPEVCASGADEARLE